LDVSKIESGKFELYPENVDVNDICRSSLTFIQQFANKKFITLEYTPLPSAPIIIADPKRLRQMLINLLNNAVKFTNEKGIVRLEVQQNVEESLMRFSITDTGIGISPDDLQRLFKPFVQVDSRLNRQYEGTGLGLALVKRMVEMHNGSLEVQSEVGVGSRFTFILPWSQ
jgi:signal transduction histidine kinase